MTRLVGRPGSPSAPSSASSPSSSIDSTDTAAEQANPARPAAATPAPAQAGPLLDLAAREASRPPRPVVRHLGGDALASLQRSRARQAGGGEAAASLKSRLAGALSGRQLAVTAGVPGTGWSVNGPLRDGVPGQTHAGVAGPPGPLGAKIAEPSPEAGHDPVLEDARKLLVLAESMADSLDRPAVTVYERPASSAARRVANKLVPWLGPTPLKELASFTTGRGTRLTAPAPRKEPVLARGRLANEQQARRLLKDVEDRRAALDRALAELGEARAAHAAALAEAPAPDQAGGAPAPTQAAGGARLPGPAGRQALPEAAGATQARLRVAEVAVRDAGHTLHDAIHGTELLELISLSHLSDRADRHLDFSLQRLQDLKDRIHALRGTAGERRAEIEIELRAHAEQVATLDSLGDEMTRLDTMISQANARLGELGERQAALAAAGPDLAADAAELADLAGRIEQVRSVIDEAQGAKVQCEARLTTFSARYDEIAALMAERARVDRRWHVADRAVAPLLKASLALAERSDEAHRVATAESGVSLRGEPRTATQREQAALDAARQALVEQLTGAANVYGADAPPKLGAALRRLATRLTGPTPPLPLPPHMSLEIVTRAAHDVGLEAGEAAALLDRLAARPVTHWVALAAAAPPGGDGRTQPDEEAKALELCRKLASLPRGVDLLHALSSEGDKPPEAARSQALRVFWNADQAQHQAALAEPDVSAWLQQAKHVAHATLSPDAGAVFDDVDHAAYNAVRNGYLSNAPGSPYAQHNQRLTKAITEWVMRAAASGDAGRSTAPRPTLWRRAMPQLNKTPYRKRVLDQAYRVGESMGMQSPRIQVDAHIQRRIAGLERTIAACRDDRASPQLQQAARAAQAGVDHLKQLQQRGRHLSQVRLTGSDLDKIGRRVGDAALRARAEAASEGRAPNRLRKAQPVELPDFLQQACGSGLSAYEAIEHLESQLPPELQHPATDEALPAAGDLEAAVRLLKARHFSDKTDIVTFFQPFIANSRLRDRLRIGGGGSLGANLPSLPYGVASPIASPIFTAEKSVSDEAFVQMFMPILGMEMSFGAAHTAAQEATVGVAVGPQVAPGVSLQAAFTARAASQRTDTHSTVMRFFRSRHKDDEMRANMLNALDSMVRWDRLEPERGRPFRDPLEAVFARNPAVVVSQLDAVTDTRTLTARLSARLPSTRFNDAHGVAQTLGADASLFAEAERTRDKRSETGGQVRITQAKGDTAQQRAGATLNLNFSPLSNQPVPIGPGGEHGVAQRESLPMQFGVSRDLAWMKEQHEISPFTIGDKQDADLDRHYATPREMLAEIAGNREDWLMRCIETLEPDAAGEKDNPDNRLRAGVLLEQFENEIRELGKTSQYCHYNVNYSLRGEAGVWIDGYGAVAELAEQRGDHEGAQAARRSIDEVLLMRASWRPLMLIVRERSRESSSQGWRSLLRWQRVANADGQRTAAQYPPP
ncbi:hypothetical protein [Burkholderia gladioli]|uniref:hypothetical protein n=1 Tax=Burkholderia gladioli TaxID=28095 RepID=UPI001ABB5A1B|nr:hypothetical protein [Burkholderia gladioli]